MIALFGSAGGAAAGSADARPVRVLVVKMTWGPQPFSDTDVDATAQTTSAFYATASYGQVSVAFDQTPWLTTLSGPPPCSSPADILALAPRLAALAAGAGYSVSGYDRAIFLFPDSGCLFAGVTNPDGIVLNGAFNAALVIHELGHSFGMGHANAFVCRYNLPPSNGRFCHGVLYGDVWDVMGAEGDTTFEGQPIGDFGALQKARAGWLTSYLPISKPGVYQLAQLEQASTLPQALVIQTAGFQYWVDHREPVGNDAYLAQSLTTLTGEVTTGFEVHRVTGDPLAAPASTLTPDYLMPRGKKNLYSTPPGATFTRPGAFALTALSRSAGTMTVRFHWTDHTPPSTPLITKPPATAPLGAPVEVAWRASRDTGTGVQEYLLTIDGGPPTTVPASPAQKTLDLPVPGLSVGRHRITIVAVDYAGNRSSPATRSFNLR